ncbi:putative phospholipase [Podospora australis]|uniref:Phospholipase n=1 Tax=Podospora australis TaxID=1536484 RepID=A0AAN7AMP5_9PEZI|nr:putative phospholipase [Podospora australis]
MASAPTPASNAEKKAEKSYLASAVDSINPWAGNRSTTPTPKDPQPNANAVSSNPGDHTLNPFYGQSFKRYPPDCPPLTVQWFNAVDVPKRKPAFMITNTNGDAKPVQPKKYVAFSAQDSRSLEAAYQARLQELEEERGFNNASALARPGSQRPPAASGENVENADGKRPSTKVPVNEDFLFDVDIDQRELAPIYWEGPVYEVRRGSWFYQEGSTLRPCEENLAAQLEEGYLKIKPWKYPQRSRSNSAAKGVTPKASSENLKAAAAAQTEATVKPPAAPVPQHQPQTYRLFGNYMNSVATYQDSNTAWLSSDGMLSWVTSTVYERFSGGGYMSGVKLVRGYTEAKKAKEEKRPTTPAGTKSSSTVRGDETPKAQKRRSAPSTSARTSEDGSEARPDALEDTRNQLTRQLSNLIERAEAPDPEEEEEAIRKREEKEMLADYNANAGENQGRDIEHLVLVTHGIGQLLSRRMESINFVHDVNILRKTIKNVYAVSADLRALNSEIGESGVGNCRVQVLPVVWRHRLDFPKRKPKRGEHDLGEMLDEEDDYPSLEDITIEGLAFARSLISDLALDVLLYQSAYRQQIADIVTKEANHIYKLFKERNPEFKGKVHIVGHSLGSAIMFDILCRQKEKASIGEAPRSSLRSWLAPEDQFDTREAKDDFAFDFDVEDFYCLGSPIGLFQMLKGRTISARSHPNALPSESPLDPDYKEDPFFTSPPAHSYGGQRVSPVTGHPFTVSSPKIGQLFNIFHPSDPIAYRLEPLVSQVMSTLKPQALPYTKKNIFNSVAPQGLTGIGAKVGQSVSGLWSSFSAGIASSLLNRSLGLTQEDVAKITASQQQQQQQQQPTPSAGAGTNIGAGVIADVDSPSLSAAIKSEKTAEKQLAMAASGHEGALIDDDLETLFSRFQKNRVDMAKEKGGAITSGGGNNSPGTVLTSEKWLEEERKAQKLRREEMKIRALNRNGRIDYCIQESVLDFNPMNTIASHMSYWADEDVAHFVLSQMLAGSKAKTPR